MSKRKPVRANNQVLIVKPHNVEYNTDDRVNLWIMKAFQRGVAETIHIPAKLPELARNYAIKQFLTDPKLAKKTHIFFLDADTEPLSDFAIERLLSHNKPVISGITPIIRKGEELKCMWSAVLENGDNLDTIGIDELPKSLFKAKRVGGTTLLVRRDVLEKLKSPYQISSFDDEMVHQDLSEDYYFSDKIREAGFDIWVDPDVVCHHYHKFDLLDIFSIWDATVKRDFDKNNA